MAVLEAARVEVLTDQQAALDDLAVTLRALAKGGEVAGYDVLRQQGQARVHLSSRWCRRRRARMRRARWLEAWTGATVGLPSVDLADLGGGAGVLAKLSGCASRPRHPRATPALEASAQA